MPQFWWMRSNLVLLLLLSSVAGWLPADAQKPHQKIIIIMMDGFGEDYYRSSDMPVLQGMEKKGLYKVVPSLMPSVTNVNNASIITGVTPEVNGITGNAFLNPASGKEELTEDPGLVLAPTIFERAGKAGVRSILFSCKTKTVQLLSRGTGEAVSRETASDEWIRRIGERPDIYSREINYWIMEAALYSIRHDPGLGLIYIHTTDYPMHTWTPQSAESKEHLHKIDGYLAQLIQAAPDAAILITADHNVHHKSKCWDLEKACAARGVPVKAAINPEKDKYFKHHMGMGGTEYVYLKELKDSGKVSDCIRALEGVEEVISRAEAARRYHLMPDRIGHLMVLADSTTVFGQLESAESQVLPETYRTHGSSYEARVPLFVYNAKGAPALSYFTDNYKLAAWLWR
jgi:phosphonoacetate hydrolase